MSTSWRNIENVELPGKTRIFFVPEKIKEFSWYFIDTQLTKKFSL